MGRTIQGSISRCVAASRPVCNPGPPDLGHVGLLLIRTLAGSWVAWMHGAVSARGIALDRAFADYLDAARLCRDVAAGLVSWTDILPDPTCGDPQAETRAITRDRAARALALLVHGDASMARHGLV